MKKYLPLLFCLFLISCKDSDSTAKGQDPIFKTGTNCASVSGNGGGPDWKYCMHRYNDSSDDVLIYFHGLNGDEHSWEDGALEKNMLTAWRLNGVKPPLVISISFGSTWLFAEKNSSDLSGLYEYFLGGVWPTLQDKIKEFPVDRTYLMGVSMGGFNAAQLYLKNPNLFDRVALICPAMSTISPYASNVEIQQYINNSGGDPAYVKKAIQLAQIFFPSVVDWNKHSPNVLAAQKLNSGFPPLYVANGSADPYGFAYSNYQFVQKALQMGAPVTANFYNGKGHCEVNASATALALIPQ